MKRLFALVLVAAVAAGAALVPEPEPPAEPLAGVIIEGPGLDTPVDASIWYCPWAQASAFRDSLVGVASVVEAEARLTFPVAIPGEPPDEAEAGVLGPGAAEVVLSDVARRGDSPLFVEFSDGPAASSVVVTGEVLAADRCVSDDPGEWFFVGGSTNTGEALRLRLFNPFPETARVTVQGFSEIGVEALGDLRSVSVNSRSWRDLDFEEELRQRQDLVISVRVDSGLVVPAMALTSGDDQAWWAGVGLSTTWELPVVRTDAAESAAIVVANPGLVEASATVDLFTADGAQRGAFTITVPPQSPVRVDLGDVDGEVLGARVSSATQIAAAAVSTGEAGTALTAGLPEPARGWLLPGVQTVGQNEAAIWLLNTSDEVVSVTVSALTGVEVVNTNVVVEAGSLSRVSVHEDALGYLVEGVSPISAGWSVQGPAGLAFSGAVAVPDE